MQRNEDILLGRLAVREGYCSQEQIEECLRLQASSREATPLGDLLLFKGYLTATQVKDLLSRQQKKVMSCPACHLSFTVLTLSGGKSARCPKCKGPLDEIASKGLLRTDAEFSTQRVPIPRTPTGPEIDLVCVICDHSFRAGPDASGRARCPACQSTFRSKGSS